VNVARVNALRGPATYLEAAAAGTLILGLALVTGLLAVASDGRIAVVIAPVLAIALLWIACVAPVQTTAMALMFVALVVDKPGDTDGRWMSPLGSIGRLLVENLNKTIPVSALSFSLLQVILVFLGVIHVARMFRPARRADLRRPAQPLLGAIAVSFLSAAVLCAWGVARGGDPQMCKIQLQVFIPLLLMAYLLACNLGTGDYKRLGAVVVAAACFKALMAVWVRLTLPFEFGTGAGQVQFATSHGDSMVFACALTVLMALFFERPTRRNGSLVLLIGPVLIAGLIANNRRLAWVQVTLSLAVLLGLNPTGRASRAIARTVVYAMPLILVYFGVGWSSGSKVFAPVRMVRSMGDSDVDRSTLYRDAENYNLVYTFRQNPILGTGFGHPFELAVQLDDISYAFKEWRYLPHNSVLGLWAFTGVVGFTGLWAVFGVALTLGARSYRFARLPQHRTAIACAIGAILVYFIHCWGDIGYTEYRSIFLVGAALGIIGQMAVVTGAWRPAAVPAGVENAR
jgi:hypothetical protein